MSPSLQAGPAFRALVAQSRQPMAVIDESGVFLFVNAAFARLFGEDAACEDFDGAPCAALLSEETAPEFTTSILPVALRAGFEGNLQLWRRDRASSVVPVRLTPVPSDESNRDPKLLCVEALVDPSIRTRPSMREPNTTSTPASEWAVPILPIAERVIVVPVVGMLDVRRSSLLLRLLLAGISAHRAKAVILDVTGLTVIDQHAADYLTKAVMAARLKGAYTVVSGVSPDASEALAEVAVGWRDIATVGDLKTGLSNALASVGVRLEAKRERERNA